MKLMLNKKYAAVLLGCLMMAAPGASFGSASFNSSGGMSDGGGGTTNPSPVAAKAIADAVSRDAGTPLLLWLYKREQQFQLSSAEEKLESPYAKLFGGDRTIYDVLTTTRVELRMQGACFDANGVEKEGSVYASQSDAICLSPFLMAPRLNVYNFEAESFALMAHELSHRLGTTEDDAQAIQLDALGDFHRMNLLNFAYRLDQLSNKYGSGKVDHLIFALNTLIDFPGSINRDRILPIINETDKLIFELEPQLEPQNFVRPFRLDHLRALLPTGLEVISAGACLLEADPDHNFRDNCENNLKRGFSGDRTITGRTWMERQNPSRPSSLNGPEYDQISMSYPENAEGVIRELSKLVEFLEQLRADLDYADRFKFSTYEFLVR